MAHSRFCLFPQISYMLFPRPFLMYHLLTIPELLVKFDMICMDKRLKYLPAHVIHILIYGFGSAMTRNTIYS